MLSWCCKHGYSITVNWCYYTCFFDAGQTSTCTCHGVGSGDAGVVDRLFMEVAGGRAEGDNNLVELRPDIDKRAGKSVSSHA
jgi:hypothetical protein